MNQFSTKNRMYKEGVRLVCEHGVRNFSVRKLTQFTSSNLGSFVYHFKTKERFIHQVLCDWYHPLYQALVNEEHSEDLVSVRLKTMLNVVVDFIVENEIALSNFYCDIRQSQPEVITFFSSMKEDYASPFLAVIREGQQKGEIIDGDPDELLTYMLNAIGLPETLGPSLRTFIVPLVESPSEFDYAYAKHCIDWIVKGIQLKS